MASSPFVIQPAQQIISITTNVGGGGGFDFVQAAPATPWVINHNLGKKVDVEVFSVGGLKMIADVQHVSDNQAQVSFSSATAGYAYVH